MVSRIYNKQEYINNLTLLLTRMRNKSGCSSGSKWCNTQLWGQQEYKLRRTRPHRDYYDQITFELTTYGQKWFITKVGNYLIRDLISYS